MNLIIIERILFLIYIQDFFESVVVNRGKRGYKSILQLTILNVQLFRSYQERLRFLPIITILRPIEIRNICRFIDVDLVDDLLYRGIDLETLDRGNKYTNQHTLLSQQNLELMLYQFQSRGLEPLGDLLIYTAIYNYMDVSRQILYYSISYRDQYDTVFIAAGK